MKPSPVEPHDMLFDLAQAYYYIVNIAGCQWKRNFKCGEYINGETINYETAVMSEWLRAAALVIWGEIFKNTNWYTIRHEIEGESVTILVK